jgi:HlyD family secretion protein
MEQGVLFLMPMDIARPDIKRKKTQRTAVLVGIAVLVLAGVGFAVSRLKPAAPSVESGVVWPDTVKRGNLVRQVHGLGTLEPREDRVRLIPAQTDATVVRIRVLPGATVQPDTILLDLADPTLEQELMDAQLAYKSAQVDYHNQQVKLESDLMDKKAEASTVTADYGQAKLQAETDKKLFELGVKSGLEYNKSKSEADDLTTRNKISGDQIEMNQKAIETQLQVYQAKVEQAKALYDLKLRQKDALEVKAGISGVLISIDEPLQVGQRVSAGTPVAKVVQPDELKAALKIAETQARDIAIGQPAEIDAHNGTIIPGKVTRVDPAVQNGTVTVDVELEGKGPGLRPDLSVDGTIDLETLNDVLMVGRPAFGTENSTISLFKIDPDGKGASRVQVKVGKASVTQIQILQGLKEGDRVILSDMSRYDQTDRIRLD